jgi:hypothetical protein
MIKIRYFIDFTAKQERWLNEMAAKGLRLVRCGKLTYDFEPCAPGEYQYCIEFVGEKSYAKQKDYKGFLEGLGYRVLRKNINLNLSVGKARFRPWADGAGKFVTSPGAYNKELLIVERKNDGKPFDLHTDTQDLVAHYRNIRNATLCVALIGILFATLFRVSMLTEFDLTWGFLLEWCGIALFGVVGAVGIFLAVKYGIIARRYKELGKTNE